MTESENQSIHNQENTSKEYQVTAQGSLGLLALGAVGVRKWKEALKEAAKERNQEQEETNKNKDNGEETNK